MERIDYRDNLESILRFSGNKALLTVTDVSRYTGLSRPTVRKRYSFVDGYVSAPTLARAMCSEVRR